MAMIAGRPTAHTDRELARAPLAEPAEQAQAHRVLDASLDRYKAVARTAAGMCTVAHKRVQARAGAEAHELEVELESKVW